MAESLVTIILTTLNSESFLPRSIESCLQQTHTDLELLIVDGGSTDRTLEIVDSYTDPRIRLIHQPDNSGKLPGAINLGMENAKGEYITWTQDDSWYESDAIQTMVEFLSKHPDIALVYTDFWIVSEAGDPIKYQNVGDVDQILSGDDIVGQSFLFRREVYETVGEQNPDYFPVHEIPWRIQVAKLFTIQPLHNPLVYYTMHANSLTSKFGGWQLSRLSAEAILKEGFIDKPTYNKQLAKIDVYQAYEHYVLYARYWEFWKLLLRGFINDAEQLKNRRLWKLMLISLLPIREKYRRTIFSEWQQKQNSVQQELVSTYAPNHIFSSKRFRLFNNAQR